MEILCDLVYVNGTIGDKLYSGMERRRMTDVEIYYYYKEGPGSRHKFYDDYKLLHWCLALGLRETIVILGRF